MKAFELTQAAKKDLREIAKFTEIRWGRNQRYLYLKQFDDVFHFLADNPSVGKKCDHIKIGYKKFPQGSHIIFFREGTNSKITIIRVLHKSMDVESQILDT
ncbi:type II toxin-antitoxin system RelE/ParE family toxin [Methylotuvimicrobium sp.]|uniref:type II toxin-antitoxin system RelE/ParE family toxin n=1 Tax=Methylotuvimicrobium sp. TaxID=2822413 RepID=UPI003D65BAA4